MSNRQESDRRVVVTGVGVVSSIGIGRAPFWESLAAGRSGIAPIDQMDQSAAPRNIGGEVKDFNEKSAKNWINKKSIKVMCREIQLGVASATLALEDAAIPAGSVDPERLGVDFGANLMLSPPQVLADACFACVDPETQQFQHERWGTQGLSNMQPLWLLQYLPNMPACHIGIAADARGPNNSMTMAEASGNMTILEASRIVARGSADVMITGTTGTTLHPVQTLHAALWDQLSDFDGPPEAACRPFDRDRRGQVVAEGACTLILEDEQHAQNRGAKILGHVLGASSACVNDRSGKADIKRALVLAIRNALRQAGLKPSDIGHVHAHGLGTHESDRLEAQAILEVFTEESRRVPVTALKSYIGNPGASCGSLEIAASLLSLQQGTVFPTLNFQTPDPECPLNVVRGEPLPVENRVFLNINVTRMGQASAAILRAA